MTEITATIILDTTTGTRLWITLAFMAGIAFFLLITQILNIANEVSPVINAIPDMSIFPGGYTFLAIAPSIGIAAEGIVYSLVLACPERKASKYNDSA